MIDEVIRWTAGPPRPLLYVFHMMQILSSDLQYLELFKTKEGLREVFDLLYKFVAQHPSLETELGAVSRRGNLSLSAEEQKAYNYFCFASWQKASMNPATQFIPGTQVELTYYLRSFNIFASKVVNSEKVQLVAPAFVSRFLFERSCATFFLHMYQFKRGDKASLFEYAIPDVALVYQHLQDFGGQVVWFPGLLPTTFTSVTKLSLWECRGPIIQENGKMTQEEIKATVLRCGATNYAKILNIDNLEIFLDELATGQMVLTGPRSATADIFVKAGKKKIIEFQLKAGKQRLSSAEIKTEIKKSVVKLCPNSTYESQFVLVCASGTKVTKIDSGNPKLTVHIPTVEQLKNYFGSSLLKQLRKAQTLKTDLRIKNKP